MKVTCEKAMRLDGRWHCRETKEPCLHQHYCAICGGWKLSERVFTCQRREEKNSGQNT